MDGDELFKHVLGSPFQFRSGVKVVTFKNYYLPDPDAVEKFLQKNCTHPTHGLFVDVVSFFDFHGGNSYTENNITWTNT